MALPRHVTTSHVKWTTHTQNINIQEIFADWWVLLNSEIVYEYIGKLVFTLDEKVANGLLAKAKKASTTAPCSVPEKEYLRFIGGDWIEIFSVVPETNYIFLLLLLEGERGLASDI
ncbi:11920_t:CDS:2 [Rhizophagus irregularis]|nr:11920_t:CDS:2 [Rhizophagus irregularis]